MKYFGTDGFRGEANVTLNVEHAYKVGRFLGNYFQKEDHKVRVVIGKDTRLSGYMFETALASGLTLFPQMLLLHLFLQILLPITFSSRLPLRSANF